MQKVNLLFELAAKIADNGWKDNFHRIGDDTVYIQGNTQDMFIYREPKRVFSYCYDVVWGYHHGGEPYVIPTCPNMNCRLLTADCKRYFFKKLKEFVETKAAKQS